MNEKFVCIDCEATGLDVETDRIIEIAVVIYDMKEMYERFESLVDPKCEIPESSILIHHITQDMVQGKPPIDEVLEEVLRLVGNHIIVGHNIQYDIDLVANAAALAGIPTKIRKNTSIDTLRMARAYGESPKNSLEVLRAHFNIELEGAHRAMNDVVVNIEVFRHLARQYKSVEHILRTLEKPVMLRTMPLGPHKGRPFREVPQNYLHWAANKDFDRDLLYSIRSELKKRKQGNVFHQAGNPFLDL